MNSVTAENKKGFTIIEVVLVLAIAALIFLMVFIALPALQRNQRDTARKTIVGKVASAITSFQSNNRGRLPARTGTTATADAIAIGRYIDANPAMTGWGAPTGNIDNQYTLQAISNAAIPAAPGNNSTEDIVYYVPQAECNGTNGAASAVTSTRKAAVMTILENGNYSGYFCQAI